ncbi:MAG: D-glycero-beta-D-manno-heptose 1-phosphate adenylyltransferase [Candidatus Aegiribacteria sp.]
MLSRTEAAGVSRRARRSGLALVFTNGCFDIVHPGHVHLLRAARSMGDLLIVGVNTDESVRRLKGEGRPVNGLPWRLKVLSEFRSVDYLVPFPEDTPLELIKAVRPDVLVKGGDYSEDSVVGSGFVTGNGGTVRIVPLLGGFSSSGIIETLNDVPDGSALT